MLILTYVVFAVIKLIYSPAKSFWRVKFFNIFLQYLFLFIATLDSQNHSILLGYAFDCQVLQ